MQGFQVTFFTHQGRRRAHEAIYDWLMHILASQGIKGATLTMGANSYGRSGKRHSRDFIELADQPIEVTAAMTEAQSASLFELLEREQVDLFFIKSPVEYGVLGSKRPGTWPDRADPPTNSVS
jgi:PII-like signaling protein